MADSYSWMPGWLRKFLNLDDDMPGYGPSSGGYREQSDYSAPPRQSLSYTPPAQSSYTPPAPTYTPPAASTRYTPNYPAAPAAEETPRRYTSGADQPPPAPVAPRGVTAAPPPTPPRTVGQTGTVQPDGTVSPGGNVPTVDTQGYVQPVGYMLRSYARGALPPQGLEQFTREFRATLTDVWNLYSYWTRFQTDELVRIGREAMDTVVDNLPASAGGASTSSTSVRRIKVTVGNGEKPIDRVATTTTVDPPPVPTPAAPPTPPAPTARFSPTVTADDDAIPPEGRDISTDFAQDTAAQAVDAAQDTAAQAADAAQDTAARAADAVDDAAKKAADRGNDAPAGRP